MHKALTLPLLVTLFLHGMIVAVILIDMPDSSPVVKRAATQYINAKLVTLDKQKAKPPAVKPSKPKVNNSKAKELAAAKKKQAEQARLAEQKKAKLKQQQLKKQQLKQQQLKAQQQEQARELERQQAQQRKLREQSEREMAEAIERENALILAENDAQLVNSYIALITDAISNNWTPPPSARNGMSAELSLQLIPTGEVVGVVVVKSSGNLAFDRSAETAVLKAKRFPELQNVPARIFEQNFRPLNLIFRPEDLRL